MSKCTKKRSKKRAKKRTKTAEANSASLANTTLRSIVAQLKADGVSGPELKAKTIEVVKHMYDALTK